MTAEKMFVADLRRVLANMKIYDTNLQWLKESSKCPSRLKYAINNVINANKRLFDEIGAHYKQQQRDEIHKDLNSEKVKDINLLVDFALSINNVGELMDVLNEQLQLQHENV